MQICVFIHFGNLFLCLVKIHQHPASHAWLFFGALRGHICRLYSQPQTGGTDGPGKPQALVSEMTLRQSCVLSGHRLPFGGKGCGQTMSHCVPLARAMSLSEQQLPPPAIFPPLQSPHPPRVPSLHCLARQYLFVLWFVLPICHTHVLALPSHHFKSVTCVYSVTLSLQRRCTGVMLLFQNQDVFFR